MEAAAHPLHIGHGAAQCIGGQLQRKIVPRFQQLHAVPRRSHPQALPHGAVGRLPKVPALGVLLMGAARRQRDPDIGQRCADQHARVGALGQMGQNQPLPVFGQRVGRAVCRQLDAAAPGRRLQQQMHLGIVAQRLIVADALDSRRQRLLIQNAALAECYIQPEPLLQDILQNFQLHLAHQLDMHFAEVVPPVHMQLGVLVLQRLQCLQQGMGVGCALDTVVQHRLQQRGIGVSLRPKALPGAGGGRPCRSYDHTGVCLADQAEFSAVVQPQRIGLLAAGQHRLDLQHAAGDLEPCQPCARVLADLEHPRTELRPARRGAGQRLQPAQQAVQPVQPQCRAEKHREHLPPRNGRHHGLGRGLAVFQHLVHQRLTAQGQCLRVGHGRKIHAPVPEPPAQLPQADGGIGTRQVHLVHKHKGGHPVAGQQLPERLGVGLHAVRAGDHQHRIIQHLQGTLGLGGKIHMSRRVQQGQFARLRSLGGGQRQHRLLGKDRNAPRPLPAVGIQKCVPVIHAAQLAQYPRAVKQPLGQCGFAAVHMGQQPNDQSFHTSSPQKIKILFLLYNFSCHLANALLHRRPCGRAQNAL